MCLLSVPKRIPSPLFFSFSIYYKINPEYVSVIRSKTHPLTLIFSFSIYYIYQPVFTYFGKPHQNIKFTLKN